MARFARQRGTPTARSALQTQGQAQDEQQGEHEAAQTGVIDRGEEVHAEGPAHHGGRGKAKGEPGHLRSQEPHPPLAHEYDQLISEKSPGARLS